MVRRERGADNIVYLESLGLGGPNAALAHCVHATDDERRRLAASGTHVVHCPSSNLKLGSGIAPIPEMLAQGIHVALGADGAPCNNNLDGFVELRLAALLHKPRAGATAMPAATALELATLGGAAALGLEREIGSLEPGKRADLIVVEPRTPHATPSFDPVSTLVYADAEPRRARRRRRRPRAGARRRAHRADRASTATRSSPPRRRRRARSGARARVVVRRIDVDEHARDPRRRAA